MSAWSPGSLADFENETVPEVYARFLCVYGCEFTDARLTWAEKGVLWYLRYRCCNTFRGGHKEDTGETIMSWSRFGEEIGEPVRTLRRRIAKLKKLGFIRCSSRGLGRSHIKIIVRPSAMYDPDTFMNFDRLISGKRSEEKLRMIRSLDMVDNDVQDEPNDAQGEGVSGCNDDMRRPAKNGRTIAAKNGRSPAAKSGRSCIELEYGEIESDSEEPRFARDESGFAESATSEELAAPGAVVGKKDTSHSGQGRRAKPTAPRPSASAPSRKRDRDSASGLAPSRRTRGTSASGLGTSREGESISLSRDTLVPLDEVRASRAGEEVDTSAEFGEARTPAEIEDDRKQQLEAVARSAGARAKKKAEDQLRKRAAKKARQEASGEAERIDKLKAMSKKERQTVGSQLHDHCEQEFEKWFPEVKWGRWYAQEYSQAKRLLEAYDGDMELVKRAWDYCCENWDDLKKRLKLPESYPTIGFLLGFRARVFPLVQAVRSRRNDLMDDSDKGTFEW